MNRINEIDNTIEGKETKTYYQDHPELVVLSGRLYGKVTYAEYFDAYYLQFGDNVYYFPQKDSYQEGRNWKKKKFDSYEECLNFSQQHNIKIVMKSTVKSPFSNGLPDSRFLFPKRNTPYNPSERTDVSRIRENKHNTYYNMNKKLIRLTESDLHKIVKESVGKILKESSWADGQEMIQAYHITTVGAEDSSQEEADFAYQIYDRLTHNEMTADEAIRAITNGDLTPDTEPEVVPRDVVNFGISSDGRYFLTYDKYTGAFDVWERTMNESKKTKSVNEAYNKYNELQRFAYENQQIRPMIQELANFAEDIAQIGKMRGKDNYYQFYHKLNGDILQMKNLWNFLDDIDD